MKSYLFLLFSIICNNYAFSQASNVEIRCATTEADAFLKNHNPGYKNCIENESLFRKHIASLKHQIQAARTAADTIVVPVIVHVVHNGDAVGSGENITAAQVMSQFDVLNEDYQRKAGTLGFNTRSAGAGMAIKFVPAAYDPQGNSLAECGIDRVNGGRSSWDDITDIEQILKPATIYDPTKYLNIWVVSFGGVLKGRLGYAQMPDFSSLSGINTQNETANSDGLVIRFNVFGRVGNIYKTAYSKGRTTTHEMGHFFGLLHIWGNNDTNLDCSEDDGCEDTPKTTGPIYNCPTFRASCSTTTGAMIDNYMDYADDPCMHTLTIDQKDRILAVLANSPRRKELTNSKVYEIDLNVSISNDATSGINCTAYNFSVSGASTYMWSNTVGLATSAGNTFSLKTNSDAVVTLKATTRNSCTSQTKYLITVAGGCQASATKNDLKGGIEIYPNPFDEKLMVKAQEGIVEISIFNSLGTELLLETNASESGKMVEIAAQHFSEGVYFLKITTKKGIGVWKIVKHD